MADIVTIWSDCDRNVEKVHDLMDEVAEQQEVANEITEAISNPVGFNQDVDEVASASLCNSLLFNVAVDSQLLLYHFSHASQFCEVCLPLDLLCVDCCWPVKCDSCCSFISTVVSFP